MAEILHRDLDVTRFRERSGGDFLKPVFDKLMGKLEGSVLPARLQELQTLFPVVEAMLTHVALKEQLASENPELFNEKLIATFGIAKHWKESNSLDDKRDMLFGISTLWDEDRRPLLFEGHETLGSNILPGVVTTVLKEYFPESEGKLEWFKGSNLVKDHIVEIPASELQISRFLTKYYRKHDIPTSDPRFNIFRGMASSPLKIAFVVNNATNTVREHERNHLKYSGLRFGSFGGSLDEGMTELLAEEKVKGKVGFLHRWLGSAGEETHILTQVFEEKPALKSVFTHRYQEINETTSNRFIENILNNFGTKGFFDIIRTLPRLRYSESGHLPTSSWYETFKL